MDHMLSNGSRGTLMSYTDHSMQRRLKSNAPYVKRGAELSGRVVMWYLLHFAA